MTSERSLGLQWVLATIVGWAIGFFVCEAIKPVVYDFTHLGGDGLLIGGSIGIAQAIVLRRRVGGMWPWLLVTAFGFGVGKWAGEMLSQGISGAIGHFVTGAVIGLAVGVAQWLVLRRHVARAERWILASGAAWAVGWTLISLTEGAENLSVVVVYLIGGAGAAVAGIITAYLLIRLWGPRPA